MNKDKKKIVLTSPIWEYKRIADICTEQSKQGYQLEKIKVIGASTFVKDEKQRYIYDIDFNTVILKKGKERENYLEIFEEQGWEFIDNTFNGFSLFRKKYIEGQSDEEYKIYTDNESSKELYYRMENLLKLILLVIIPLEIVLMGIGATIFSISAELSLKDFWIIFLLASSIACLPLTIFLKSGIKSIRKQRNS